MLRPRDMTLRLVILTLAAAVLAVSQPTRLLAQGTVHTQPIDPFGQEITLPRDSVEKIDYYENMVLERVQRELLQDKPAAVARSAALRRAEMLR